MKYMYLFGNQFTSATKHAIYALSYARLTLAIPTERHIPEELTPEILQAHFEAMKPALLSSMDSSLFKHAVMRYSWQGAHAKAKFKLPTELAMNVMNLNNIGPEALLNENVAMLKWIFSNSENQLATLNKFLDSSDYEDFEKEIKAKQQEAIADLSYEFRKNLQQASKNINNKIKVLDSILSYGGAPALIWQHKPSYGLVDKTPIEPRQNPFQLALKPKM